MGRKKRGGPEETLDKAVGGLSEATGRATGDKSLEAEGRALRTKGELKTYLVRPHPEKGWKVEAEGARRASSVHRTSAESSPSLQEGRVERTGGKNLPVGYRPLFGSRGLVHQARFLSGGPAFVLLNLCSNRAAT